MKKNNKIILSIICIIAIILVLLIFLVPDNTTYISYNEFLKELQNGDIVTVSIQDNKVYFSKKSDECKYYTDNPETDSFKEELLKENVKIEDSLDQDDWNLFYNILFNIMFFGIIAFGAYKLISMNKNTFKIVKNTNVKFEDIAGMERLKTEMIKNVEILKSPEEYKQKGIRPIKGIILEGSPGNGKTLFAKALAGEAGVNFIATKGADFQSAMMSMGARKIKMLFKKARKHTPCIIFIDEFDGIGEKRNYTGTGVDKENNRIITAMLNEMDGFEEFNGVLVIAATNSYASLDPALIRPGRFDIKYNVSNPDEKTRIKLIELYTKNKKLSKEVNMQNLAKAFENLSSSAIETILNEASLISNIENNEEITVKNIIQSAENTGCRINIRKL